LLLRGIEVVERLFRSGKLLFLHLSKTIAIDEQHSNPFTIKTAFNDEKA